MTEHLKITAKIPRKRYVADGTQTVFSFDFVLFQPSELLVTVNGVPVASGVAVSLLADGTGIATFAAAPAASAVVVLQRRVTIKRETDFQEGGELRAKTLNDEFDFQTAALQQLEAAAARALRLPADDADDAATVLPIAAVRATRMLAFDASGNPTVSNQTLAQIEAGSNAAVTSAADAAASAAAAAASAASVGSLATAAANAALEAAVSAASISLPLPLASGGTGADTAATARANLGLGSVATLSVGSSANQVPRLDGLGRLPAVDGSQLTNLTGGAMQIVAGETLAIRDLVYQDIFNQRGGGADRWYQVDSDAVGPVRISPRIGIALAAIASGASGSAQLRPGRVPGFAGLVAGQPLFASASPGGIAQSAPTIPASGTQNATRLIGYAASATEIDFDPAAETVFSARYNALPVAGTLMVQHWVDAGAREREQTAYLVQATTLSAITGGTGTNIGDFTGNSGLAGIFDGFTNQDNVGCGYKPSATSGYAGKTILPGKRIVQAIVWGSNNIGYVNAIDPTVTLVLRGKTGAVPASRTDGTSLGSVTFADTGNESGNPRTIVANDTATTWDHVWIDFSHDGAANNVFIAEIQFTEITDAARDEPLTIGSTIVNAAATDRVNVRYDDGSGMNADTRTTFVNRTNATRDLVCEVML
ncbi:MAG: hypothetical protein ACK5XB_07460 [Rhodospirillales bacterium]|jgi:hypothetical protein